MAFDLENAVQQGFNRDVTTNDWHVEARNLEIKLGDHGGVREFRILDDENVGVVVADSDGYLAIAGNAEVHGGHVLVKGESLTNTEFVTLQDHVDESSLFLMDADPNGVVVGTRASLGLDYTDGYAYINRDDDTTWERLATIDDVEEISSAGTTLQIAYDNDVDGGDAIITTNSTDGAVKIDGDQKFWVTATGGIDLDTGFDMDGAGPFDVNITGAASIDADADSNFTVNDGNLTLETQNTGDVIVRVPATGGDFVVDEGVGIDYIRAETVSSELRLGNIDSGTGVDVRVLSNTMTVEGDLVVNGTTTSVNTEELYVEDRLMRLNVGAAPSFNGTVGIEAEVGSDGYVEFHWDDNQSRWEISIDRNTTSEAETFRPLPYLADSPATLDLSNTGDDGWPTAGPNPTAGASVINTNQTNYPYTFGPDMTDDSVQAALEAIDGYFIEMNQYIDDANDVTLHQAYKNDPDAGGATITTDPIDGPVVIAGTQSLTVNSTGGINLDTGFDMDGAGPFDVNITGAASIDTDAASNFTVVGADLTLSTSTSGDVNVNAASDVDVDGTNVLLDATNNIDLRAAAAFEVDAYADSHVTVTGGELVLDTLTSGSVHIDGVDGISLDANGNNVLPAVSCQDALGDASHGWTDIYLCDGSDNVVPLGDDGDDDAPNTTAGAYVVGTNSNNFNTFGPDMTTNTVQAALEAIDGYLEKVITDDLVDLTLQDIYDNSCGSATITLSEECGPITIEGTEQFIFNNDPGILLTQNFNMTGDGPFIIDITGPVNITTDEDINLASGDNVNIYGEGGIVLDGYGNNVIPFVSCQDSLGDATHGWTDVYLCDGANNVIPLGGEGGDDVSNTTAGAYVVGTNANNFNTFGPDMTTNTVQAALEAIDGYLEKIIDDDLVDLTFQDIYDNSCGDETITLSEECGPLTFNGTGQVIFNNTDGVLLTQDFNMTGDGPFIIDISGPVNITTDEDINLASGDNVNIYGEGGIVLDGYGNNVIPFVSCQDSLGDATHGWTDVYLCDGANNVVGLGDEGGDSVSNTTSGAYVVGTNANNFETFGPDMTTNTVQAALEAIDGYLKDFSLEDLDTTYVKEAGLDINGCVLNGVGKVWTSAGTPGLSFSSGSTSRASWSLPVPTDWDGVSDIEVEFVWAPSDGGAGNVEWRLEYKSLAVTELASSAASTDDYTQAAGGTADAIQTTTDNLVIPAAAVSTSDEIMVINAVRRGSAAGDTYGKASYVYLVKYRYVAQNIV